MKLETLISKFHGKCVFCGKKVDISLHQSHEDSPTRDHFIPLSNGGSRAGKNVVLSCRGCNNRKGNMDPRLILYAWLKISPETLTDAVEGITMLASDTKHLH